MCDGETAYLVWFLSVYFAWVPSLAPASGYTDVPETSWHADTVEYVTDKDIMQGTGNGRDRFAAVRLFHDPEQLLLGLFPKTRSSCFRLSTHADLRLSTSRYKGI